MFNLVYIGSFQHEMSDIELDRVAALSDHSDFAAELVFCNGTGLLELRKPSARAFERLLEAGFNGISLSEQSVSRASSRQVLEGAIGLVRPMNLSVSAPGSGSMEIITSQGPVTFAALTTGSDRSPARDPVDVFEAFLASQSSVRAIFVDFSGPNMMLKKAMAWKFRRHKIPVHWFGSGSGVPTADLSIENGRFYVTDIGAVGSHGRVGSTGYETWWNRYRFRSDPPSHLPDISRSYADELHLSFDENFLCVSCGRLRREVD